MPEPHPGAIRLPSTSADMAEALRRLIERRDAGEPGLSKAIKAGEERLATLRYLEGQTK